MHDKVILLGRLGADPDMRFTPSGQAVCNFRLATNSGSKDNQRTKWWRVSVFGKHAEPCNEYLSKGSLVYVEGQMSVDENTGGPRVWTAQDGSQRASLEVLASTVRFVQTVKREESENEIKTEQEAELPF